MRALRRHNTEKKKKKEHPASQCSNAGCLICHSGKVLKISTREKLRQIAKVKDELSEI